MVCHCICIYQCRRAVCELWHCLLSLGLDCIYAVYDAFFAYLANLGIVIIFFICVVVFFQAEDGIRDLVRSRGLGDVYKRQCWWWPRAPATSAWARPNSTHCRRPSPMLVASGRRLSSGPRTCLLYTSDAADERSSVDLGGRRIIKKKKWTTQRRWQT